MFIDDLTYTEAAAVPTKTFITAPDGLAVTQTNDGQVSYPLINGHGDIVGTVGATVASFVASPATDEFGIGAAPSSRLGWLGGYQRYTTHTGTGLIRMGVRIYDPYLGRFLQSDPIEGGSHNAYDYGNCDPINQYDLQGRKPAFQAFEACLRGMATGALVSFGTGAGVVVGVVGGCATDVAVRVVEKYLQSDLGKALGILDTVGDIVSFGTHVLNRLF